MSFLTGADPSPPEAGRPNTKNLLKNRVLDPPWRGDVKFVLARLGWPVARWPVDNLVEEE